MAQEKRKILRTSATRWLSHQKCVERIIENWYVLIEFFKQAVTTDKLKSAEMILCELTNQCNKVYLLFLKYVLTYFNQINALFQSKKPLIHELHQESVKLFMQLGQNFIKKITTYLRNKRSVIFGSRVCRNPKRHAQTNN